MRAWRNGRRTRLRIWRGNSWRFKSSRPHQSIKSALAKLENPVANKLIVCMENSMRKARNNPAFFTPVSYFSLHIFSSTSSMLSSMGSSWMGGSDRRAASNPLFLCWLCRWRLGGNYLNSTGLFLGNPNGAIGFLAYCQYFDGAKKWTNHTVTSLHERLFQQ